jgi:polygalacturonase
MILLLYSLFQRAPVLYPPMKTRSCSDYNIHDFGAVGDGQTLDSPAIQSAIDHCTAEGGGSVLVPAGTYLAGTIFLKDNVNLHLAPGAVIVGSPNREDYNRDDLFPQNVVFANEHKVTGAHLLLALEVKNVSITGQGVIDGNSQAFFGPSPKPGAKFPVREWRPGQMVYFVECENVLVENVELNNAPYWTLLLHGCSDVRIRGLRITNPRETHNGDGIDIDSCRQVVISDCLISAGDDCITLRGYSAPLKDKTKICEHVAVTNCILSTPHNAIRVGVGDGAVRNCVFSNIVVRESQNGICLIANYVDGCRKGTDIENIRFSNFVMDTWMPFYIFTGRKSTARIRNISFSDIQATGCKSSFLSGIPGARLSHLTFRNIDLEIRGGKDTIAPDDQLPQACWEWDKGRPAALYCAHAEEVLFDGVTVRWGALDGPWRHALLTQDCTAVRTLNTHFPDPADSGKDGL